MQGSEQNVVFLVGMNVDREPFLYKDPQVTKVPYTGGDYELMNKYSEQCLAEEKIVFDEKYRFDEDAEKAKDLSTTVVQWSKALPYLDISTIFYSFKAMRDTTVAMANLLNQFRFLKERISIDYGGSEATEIGIQENSDTEDTQISENNPEVCNHYEHRILENYLEKHPEAREKIEKSIENSKNSEANDENAEIFDESTSIFKRYLEQKPTSGMPERNPIPPPLLSPNTPDSQFLDKDGLWRGSND